ncbi:hypothetical protein CAL28_15885 [Bordetella genomosp. 11]|uniref:3-hydroxyacyl-CoA dehydrogenase NAD binding domain-containing protein n=1 Tax=Bordetella genomosp. 11 TaxID=1416808 RepID=A0A261UJ13_9BORD|nr:hypothetical protein CAL28_15885 [Bordetella genomosp. 11]
MRSFDVSRRIALFQELDTLASVGAVIASSTSGVRPGTFTAGLAHRERCLVAHPPNHDQPGRVVAVHGGRHRDRRGSVLQIATHVAGRLRRESRLRAQWGEPYAGRSRASHRARLDTRPAPMSRRSSAR